MNTPHLARWLAPALALSTALVLGLGAGRPAQAQAPAAAFELVTLAEAQQAARAEAAAPPAPRTRSLGVPRPNQPRIRVVAPNAPGEPVSAPVRIELVFQPAPGTRIVPASFRVLYGLLKLDLTDRLKPHATITEEGVVVDRALVPAGLHRLILQVADDQGNLAEQELRLRVGA